MKHLFFEQGWLCLEGMWVFSGIQLTKYFIEFVFVETNISLVLIQRWFVRGKDAASTQVWLREATAKR